MCFISLCQKLWRNWIPFFFGHKRPFVSVYIYLLMTIQTVYKYSHDHVWKAHILFQYRFIGLEELMKKRERTSFPNESELFLFSLKRRKKKNNPNDNKIHWNTINHCNIWARRLCLFLSIRVQNSHFHVSCCVFRTPLRKRRKYP